MTFVRLQWLIALGTSIFYWLLFPFGVFVHAILGALGAYVALGFENRRIITTSLVWNPNRFVVFFFGVIFAWLLAPALVGLALLYASPYMLSITQTWTSSFLETAFFPVSLQDHYVDINNAIGSLHALRYVASSVALPLVPLFVALVVPSFVSLLFLRTFLHLFYDSKFVESHQEFLKKSRFFWLLVIASIVVLADGYFGSFWHLGRLQHDRFSTYHAFVSNPWCLWPLALGCFISILAYTHCKCVGIVGRARDLDVKKGRLLLEHFDNARRKENLKIE